MTIPALKRTSVLQAIKELLPRLAEIMSGLHESTKYDLLWDGHRLPPKVVVSKAVEIETGKPFPESEFSGGRGAGQANTALEQLGFIVVAKHEEPALKLDLYGRYSRKDVYATQGVEFSQQNRSLIQGLSPQLQDGGYFIFITLNKEGLPAAHSCDDQIFANEFVWVTRRDRGEDHPDYVRLREPTCRVSLFLRANSGEAFAYLGELEYATHKEFKDPLTSKIQQRYVWNLRNPIPDTVLQALTFGILFKSTVKHRELKPRRSRAPSNFDEMKKAYSYAIDSSERTVVPEHQNYQVRLKKFLEFKGISVDMERDFVDVGFSAGGKPFIGEIKVTVNLTPAQAFRTALGQVLDYAHVLYPEPPNMIIFLDDHVDENRMILATKLGVSVVLERAGEFILVNPIVAPALCSVFNV